ncbi:MAG: ribosomal protein [Pseudobdellovibrio sp.]|jgi:large subunit ribosomal protein L3|nr:ribosomal protein [Pseudobdellovibrio sp.]
MSETQTQTPSAEGVKLNGLYAFKEGMATVYNDKGEAVPVTVLRYETWKVSQIKTEEKDGYSAVQLAAVPKKAKNASGAETQHLKAAGFESGAQYVKELRTEVPADLKLGDSLSIDSLAKGDVVKITSTSKGRGFQGSVRRWNFAGGPATHGSKFHRRPGSSGNRTWPGRVMPGKKFPGHWGDETITVKNVVVVDVLPAEGVVLVKGPVPGSKNTLVRLVKG